MRSGLHPRRSVRSINPRAYGELAYALSQALAFFLKSHSPRMAASLYRIARATLDPMTTDERAEAEAQEACATFRELFFYYGGLCGVGPWRYRLRDLIHTTAQGRVSALKALGATEKKKRATPKGRVSVSLTKDNFRALWERFAGEN